MSATAINFRIDPLACCDCHVLPTATERASFNEVTEGKILAWMCTRCQHAHSSLEEATERIMAAGAFREGRWADWLRYITGAKKVTPVTVH